MDCWIIDLQFSFCCLVLVLKNLWSGFSWRCTNEFSFRVLMFSFGVWTVVASASLVLLMFVCDVGKFPTLVTHQESLESKVAETKATIKFQLKKVLCMGVAVGNASMEEKQIFQNVQLSVNFLVSLLKKNWQNVSNTVFVKRIFVSVTKLEILVLHFIKLVLSKCYQAGSVQFTIWTSCSNVV